MGLKFRRQHQIGLFITDFYCHESKLVIELDGGIHEEPEATKKDRWRDEDLESLGFNVLRIPNKRLLEDPVEALELIRVAAGLQAREA